MENPAYEYWMSQNSYIHQNVFDYSTPELSAVSSLSASPTSTTFDSVPQSMAMPMYNSTYNHFSDDTTPYTFHSITPPSHSGSDESPYCSPRQHAADIVGAFAPLPPPLPQEKQHTTSGRRRAQNRAAQRAFRERKERHAKDLETQLTALTEKYRNLETSHAELAAAYEKLRKTIQVLTKDEDNNSGGGGGGETLRKLLSILHGEVTNRVKREEEEDGEEGDVEGDRDSDDRLLV